MRWKTIYLAACSFLAPVLVSSKGLLLDHQHNTKDPHPHPLSPAIEIPHLHNTSLQNATTPNVFFQALHRLTRRQNTGRCGADFASQRCDNNSCCSRYGYCGNDPEHCALLVGCQPSFGRCGDAVPEPNPTPTPIPTPTPMPTPSPPSLTSSSMSTSSAISSSSTISSSTLPPLPSSTLIISLNGQCGNSTTCTGSVFGSCCSEWYFCGKGAEYCDVGCRPEFGTCGGVVVPPIPPSASATSGTSSTVVSSSRISSSTLATTTTIVTTPSPSPSPSSTTPPVPTNVSTSGRCGPEGNGQTCTGSTFGRCCSDYGWCGTGDDWCRIRLGCRVEFGSCDA